MWNPIVYINFVYLFKVVSFRRSLKISLLYTTNIKNNSFALHLRLLLYFELKPHDLRVLLVTRLIAQFSGLLIKLVYI